MATNRCPAAARLGTAAHQRHAARGAWSRRRPSVRVVLGGGSCASGATRGAGIRRGGWRRPPCGRAAGARQHGARLCGVAHRSVSAMSSGAQPRARAPAVDTLFRALTQSARACAQPTRVPPRPTTSPPSRRRRRAPAFMLTIRCAAKPFVRAWTGVRRASAACVCAGAQSSRPEWRQNSRRAASGALHADLSPHPLFLFCGSRRRTHR